MFSKALLSAGFAAAAQAVSFTVKSSGGNATSPYAYGLMFEVSMSGRMRRPSADTTRTSTTAVMEVSTPSLSRTVHFRATTSTPSRPSTGIRSAAPASPCRTSPPHSPPHSPAPCK